MKKILFVANVAKEHIIKFHIPSIKMLKDDGWVVDVACSGEEDVPFCDKQFKTSWKRNPFTPKTFKGIKELKTIIKEGEYDVVYCHTPVGGLVARLAAKKARKAGTRVIYFAHGYHFFKGAPLLNWLLYYPMEKILARKTDDIILINREDYELTQRKFKKCTPYLLNGIGIDLDRLKLSEDREAIREQYRKELQIPSDATVLIYCAELLKNKNQTYLMRALKKVLEKNPNVYLLLAGMDHCNGEFVEYAKKIGVDAHVRFLGWRDDIAKLYVTADICTPTSIREGFGINLIEAMYFGLPVVATDNRGHRTIINDGENGFLAGLKDEATFAERILELAENKELRDKITKAAYDGCDKYKGVEVLKVLKDIINKTEGN